MSSEAQKNKHTHTYWQELNNIVKSTNTKPRPIHLNWRGIQLIYIYQLLDSVFSATIPELFANLRNLQFKVWIEIVKYEIIRNKETCLLFMQTHKLLTMGSGSNSDSSKELLHQTLTFMKSSNIRWNQRNFQAWIANGYRPGKWTVQHLSAWENALSVEWEISPYHQGTLHQCHQEPWLECKDPLEEPYPRKELLPFFSMRKNRLDAYPH